MIMFILYPGHGFDRHKNTSSFLNLGFCVVLERYTAPQVKK